MLLSLSGWTPKHCLQTDHNRFLPDHCFLVIRDQQFMPTWHGVVSLLDMTPCRWVSTFHKDFMPQSSVFKVAPKMESACLFRNVGNQNLAEEIIFLTYVRKVPGSNFGRDICCTDWGFPCCSSVSLSKLDHESFVRSKLLFTVIQSFGAM